VEREAAHDESDNFIVPRGRRDISQIKKPLSQMHQIGARLGKVEGREVVAITISFVGEVSRPIRSDEKLSVSCEQTYGIQLSLRNLMVSADQKVSIPKADRNGGTAQADAEDLVLILSHQRFDITA
jgi:hypothetical protein